MFGELIKKNGAAAHEYTVSVGGMKCPHCAKKVTDAIEALPGVKSAEATVAEGKVSVRSSRPLAVDAVKKAIAATGFEFLGLSENAR